MAKTLNLDFIRSNSLGTYLRDSDKYIELKTSVANCIKILLDSDSEAKVSAKKKITDIYLWILTLVWSSKDPSLLIMGMPYLIIVNNYTWLINFYEAILHIVTEWWDSYYPNSSQTSDYLYLRYKDMNIMDKFLSLYNTYWFVDKDKKVSISALQVEEGDTIMQTVSPSNVNTWMFNAAKDIHTKLSKLDQMLKYILYNVDDKWFSDSVVYEGLTNKAMQKICLVYANFNNMKNKYNDYSQPINDAENNNKVKTKMESNELKQLIFLTDQLIHSKQDHILIYALKYVLENFNVSTTALMKKMLEDSEFNTVVSIIINAYKEKR